jgi:epsilon-lactone hydrolase
MRLAILGGVLLPGAAAAPAQTATQPSENPDTTVIGKDGAARITRVIPVPKTISSEAQALLVTGATWAPGPRNPESKKLIEKARELFPVKIEEQTIAGVRVQVVTPAGGVPDGKRDRVLINLHGGGFTTDSGSFLESIPIAALTQTEVIAVDYRLAPNLRTCFRPR